MSIKLLFFLSLKNLRRHLRRTTINVLGVGFCVGVIFFFIGYYRGTYIVMMRESFIKYQSGNIQITSKSFDEKKFQDYVSKETVISEYKEDTLRILQNKEVSGVSDRLEGFGFFGNGKEKIRVKFVGVVSKEEKKFNVISNAIKEGNFLEENGVIVGKKLKDLFGLKLNDMCYLSVQTIYNTPNILVLPLVGVFETGFYDLDKGVVFLKLETANSLFDTVNSINKKVIFLRDINMTKDIFEKLKKEFSNKYQVNSWEYYGQALLENEKGDSVFYIIFITILVFISISMIMSTMYISVFERTREIGTLRAIGWEKKDVFRLFIFESLWIGIIGSVAGLILGGIPTLYLQYFGIEYSKMTEVISFPIFKIIARSELSDVVVAVMVGIISTYFGAFFPARKASKMVIVDCLRITG